MEATKEMTAEFSAKWRNVFNYMFDEEFSIRVYQNKRHPYVFARQSCGGWEVWEMNPENDWRQKSVLCTYEYMMENY